MHISSPTRTSAQWKSFCQGLLLYSAQPHLLSASAGHSPPSVASSPANTLSPSPESRVPSSVSATTLNTFSPVSSTSLTASPSLLSSSSRPFLPKRQQSQEHGQQPSSLVGSVTHDHAPGREEDDPFSLDTLSARVASSCLGEDEEEQETVGPPTQFPDARLGPPDPLYPQPAEASRHMHVAPMGEHGRGHLGSLQASPSFHPYYSPMATPYLPGGPSNPLPPPELPSLQQLQDRSDLAPFQPTQLPEPHRQGSYPHHLHRHGSSEPAGGGGLCPWPLVSGAGGGGEGLGEGGAAGGVDDAYGLPDFGFLDEVDEGGAEEEGGREDLWEAQALEMAAVEEDESYIWEMGVNTLLGSFPHCAPEALLTALLRCDLDLEEAVARVEEALKPGVAPCRYYLAGFCARSDCAFSHAIATTTCVHWLLGSCRDGMLDEETQRPHTCPFWHDLPPKGGGPHDPAEDSSAGSSSSSSSTSSSSSSSSGPPFSATDESHFPALSSSSATTSAAASPSTPGSNTPGKSFLQVALTSKRTSLPRRRPTASSRAASVPAPASARRANAATAQRSRRSLEALWVMGGEEVRQTYVQARAGATEAAKARNQFFMRATEAFQRGDKAAGAESGGEGGGSWEGTVWEKRQGGRGGVIGKVRQIRTARHKDERAWCLTSPPL